MTKKCKAGAGGWVQSNSNLIGSLKNRRQRSVSGGGSELYDVNKY